jgi:RNA polymerase sigma-70 factor (ECF subfamily)
MTELELIDGCMHENNAARKKLYEIYSSQMMGICLRYIGDRMIAQDLLHDGFIKVFMSVHTFQHRGEGSFKAWMSRIFINMCLEYLRKNNVTKEAISLENWQEKGATPEEEDYEVISNEVLMKFISELPIGYRTIFNMYTFEDFSHKEIGELLGINEASSRSQLSRAKSILAKKVKDYIKMYV